MKVIDLVFRFECFGVFFCVLMKFLESDYENGDVRFWKCVESLYEDKFARVFKCVCEWNINGCMCYVV